MTTKHILIVDDQQDIREATQSCLEVLGEWEVITARSVNGISTSSALFTGAGVVYLEDNPDAPTHFLYANVTMCGCKPERFILSENPLPIVSCPKCANHLAWRFL